MSNMLVSSAGSLSSCSLSAAAASHVPASKRSSLLQVSAHHYTVIELTGSLPEIYYYNNNYDGSSGVHYTLDNINTRNLITQDYGEDLRDYGESPHCKSVETTSNLETKD